ncbi:hypothetical protein [Cellulomonas dongxiuzhuiae]|uniref:DUF3592 domain-containing protein n=1 Tax=Cellulomonas dongxiuzhuiae TaxID=2819979 RepID=A0ABX8GK16_9CELL|nr:hypothetical protein [Cellulomonas dongxiuzhuiae]MBO3094843.1 hypothetical protein [Cellulomonas dongxiuzhuiae]QWC15876.1 hypothetical protein KKR89_16725 [Cellulomonas dongxiuzhuiae]
MSAHPSSPVPAPRRTSLAGPVTLTVTGVVLLVVALVLAVVAAAGFVGAVRSDVLTRDGRPGSAVLASADAPGAARVDLTAGERYAVYLVVPRDAVRDDERPDLDEDVLLLAPSGAVIEADDSPGVNMESGVGGLVAVTVGAFTATETGTYDMAVPPTDVPGAWVALAPDKPFGPFFGAIWGTVLGVFGVLGLSAVGFGALVGGIVWWVVRARARRSA